MRESWTRANRACGSIVRQEINELAELEELINKSIVVVMCREKSNGDDEWAVMHTTVRRTDEGLFLDMGEERPLAPFPKGLEKQVTPTPRELGGIAQGAEFCLNFLVGELDDAEGRSGATPLGVEWPSEE